MNNFLLIETSGTICSMALSCNGMIWKSLVCEEAMQHASKAALFAKELIEYAKSQRIDIEAVAISGGPGSYTGLRIGASLAKGICYAMGIKLIAVDTLELIAVNAVKDKRIEDGALICPMIDARRMEVYTSLFDSKTRRQTADEAKIIDSDSYKELSEKRIYFCGNGAEKCREILSSDNHIFIDNINPMAEDMLEPAAKRYAEGKFEDVAYYEPFYLKEFQATTPKK